MTFIIQLRIRFSEFRRTQIDSLVSRSVSNGNEADSNEPPTSIFIGDCFDLSQHRL